MNRLINMLVKFGWQFSPPILHAGDQVVIQRNIPPNIMYFCGLFDELSSPTGVAWFFSLKDYAGTSDSAFAWNEFEKNGIECAMNAEQKDAVLNFWGVHFPFAMSVKDDYKFLAIGTGPANHGRIFAGENSDENELRPLATDFEDLSIIIERHLSGTRNEVLSNFLE